MTDKVLFIAHRGDSYDAPENTLASINLAWERNADGVEIDVRLTKDNQVAVIHDSNTRRTAGKFKKVSSSNMDVLRELDAGLWKGKEWAGEKIPVLDEVLPTVPNDKYIFIEIKCGTEIIRPLRLAINNSALHTGQIAFIGFNFKTMREVKRNFNRHEVYWLCDTGRSRLNLWKNGSSKIIEKALDAGFDGLDIFASDKIDNDFIISAKKKNLKVFAWTVNDPETAGKLIKAGINGITTDRPAWLKQELKASMP